MLKSSQLSRASVTCLLDVELGVDVFFGVKGVDDVLAGVEQGRERRLRSWWRHKQQTVRMALAAATHHSAQQNAAPRGPKTRARAREGVEHVQHVGLRAQKPPLPGVRPGSLFDPGPQRSDRTVRHSAGDAPLLVVPALRGDDGVDSTTLRFLLEQNLSLKKKQEEEEKERELKEKKAQKVKREEKLLELEARQRAVSQELDTLLMVPFVRRSDQEEERVVKLQMLLQRLSRDRSALLLAPSKRKKKKKRRKKLPKSSSFRSSSGVRPRRCGQGFRSRSSSSGGCGRLCVHARQVPAVAGLQWKVPPSISPTKWWTFQLCYGDRLRSCSLPGGRCLCCAGRAMPVVVLTGAHGSDTA